MKGVLFLMYSPAEGIVSQIDFLSRFSRTEMPIIVTNDKVEFINWPGAFDIETSSFIKAGKKHSIMYHWQFGLLNEVTSGRTWDSFFRFCQALQEIFQLQPGRRHLVIYVHNLPYEFQYMRKWFSWTKAFFLDRRKILYCVSQHGIEFRCSYKLSNKSLANTAKDIRKYPIKKMVGDLDYSKLRHSKTPLTQKELKYCENDVRVLLHYIQEKIETDGDITRIPLTNTGYVRNFCRRRCFKRYKDYRKFMDELTIEPDEYGFLKSVFQGGFTHANARRVIRTYRNVTSMDITSSYPYVMLSEKFPMSKIIRQDTITKDVFFKKLRTHCCVLGVQFTELIESTDFVVPDHPISLSKCTGYDEREVVVDNGRVSHAMSIIVYGTEQDWFTWTEVYKWEDFRIIEFGYYRKAYLPKPMLSSVLEFYKRKTELKDIIGEEVNYMTYKNMLNSTYGMTVTDIVRDIFEYSANDRIAHGKPNIFDAIDKYNTSKKRFLFYPWGVWVTAYARANLWSAILELGQDYLYSDTDSVKFLNYEKHADYFKRYNDLVRLKLQRSAEINHLNFSDFEPKNKKGKKKLLGVWENEGTYTFFKSLGAKRYLFYKDGRGLNSGKFTMTVAGTSKATSVKYLIVTIGNPLLVRLNHCWRYTDRKKKYKLNHAFKGKCCRVNNDKLHSLLTSKEVRADIGKIFRMFDDELVIPSEYSGRLEMTALDFDEGPDEGTIVDYNGVECMYKEKSSYYSTPADYHFSLSDEFEDFIIDCYLHKEVTIGNRSYKL